MFPLAAMFAIGPVFWVFIVLVIAMSAGKRRRRRWWLYDQINPMNVGTCPTCQAATRPSAKFCPRCGTRLRDVWQNSGW